MLLGESRLLRLLSTFILICKSLCVFISPNAAQKARAINRLRNALSMRWIGSLSATSWVWRKKMLTVNIRPIRVSADTSVLLYRLERFADCTVPGLNGQSKRAGAHERVEATSSFMGTCLSYTRLITRNAMSIAATTAYASEPFHIAKARTK